MEEFTRDETTDGGGATAGSAPTGGSDALASSFKTPPLPLKHTRLVRLNP